MKLWRKRNMKCKNPAEMILHKNSKKHFSAEVVDHQVHRELLEKIFAGAKKKEPTA